VIGLVKNLYTWNRDRKFIRLYGPAGAPKEDIERSAGIVSCDVPFGIRALQQGIEVEGVWISRNNTPVPGSPILTPLQSPAPSIIGGASTSTSNPFTPESERSDISPPTSVVRPRAPSFTLDSWQLPSRDAIDGLPDFSSSRYGGSNRMDSATLEVLEGRVSGFGKTCMMLVPSLELQLSFHSSRRTHANGAEVTVGFCRIAIWLR
jgi:hypothetical protein